jgi:DNA-binding response OmpR family regulator
MGHRVILAEDAGDARAQFRNGVFDLVLISLNMESGDGYEIGQMLRQSTKKPRVPILAISSISEPRLPRLDQDFDGLIIKPVTPQKLDAQLKRVLGAAG